MPRSFQEHVRADLIVVAVQWLHSRRIEALPIAVLKYANDRIYPSAGKAAQAAPLSPRKPVTSEWSRIGS
jgi:hypothetical protein